MLLSLRVNRTAVWSPFRFNVSSISRNFGDTFLVKTKSGILFGSIDQSVGLLVNWKLQLNLIMALHSFLHSKSRFLVACCREVVKFLVFSLYRDGNGYF